MILHCPQPRFRPPYLFVILIVIDKDKNTAYRFINFSFEVTSVPRVVGHVGPFCIILTSGKVSSSSL